MISIEKSVDQMSKEITIRIRVPFVDMQDANIEFVDDELVSDKLENIKRIALWQEAQDE